MSDNILYGLSARASEIRCPVCGLTTKVTVKYVIREDGQFMLFPSIENPCCEKLSERIHQYVATQGTEAIYEAGDSLLPPL